MHPVQIFARGRVTGIKKPARFSWLSLLILLSITASFCLTAQPAHAAGGTYYVATSGSDNNPGTLEQPFQSIQKCASVAGAGDTCEIRAGTYRETVTPANSGTDTAPITFRPFNGENVTIDGADPVTGWLQSQGNIYQATVTANDALFSNQVFVNGLMMNEARWPNTGFDPIRPTRAVAGSGTTTTTIYDAALTQPAGFWVGAIIHFWGHEAYLSQTGTVTSSAPGQVTFSGITGCPWMCTTEFSKYYLVGVKGALDSAGEWFYDSSAHKLFLGTPDGTSPDTQNVEIKQRNYAFDLSGKSYIQIQGLHIFAATVTTDSNSHDNVLDGITARYLSHFNSLPNPDHSFFGFGGPHLRTSGILFNGSHNILRNSDIGFSAGNGVYLHGDGHVVTNNLIHDMDYMGEGLGGITIRGDNMQITHNTIYRTGYNGISVGTDADVHNFRNENISYNDLFNASALNRDSGAVYLCCDVDYDNNNSPIDASGTTLDHNLVHDSQVVVTGANADYSAVGLYPDNGTNGIVLHHNVLWNNVGDAFHLNGGATSDSKNNLFYNNTIGGGQHYSLETCCLNDMTGTQFVNNVTLQPFPDLKNSTVSNNVVPPTDPLFVNATQNDYHLQAGSPAIDAGVVRSPYTDGFAGAAPDAGAYEYGAADWTAGSTLNTDILPTPSIIDDKVGDGTITFNWGAVQGATGYKVYYGTTSEQYTQVLDAGNTLSTTLKGLQGYTAYYFAVSAYNAKGETVRSSERWDVPSGGNRDASQLTYAGSYTAASSGVSNHKTFIGDYGIGSNNWVEYDNMDFGTAGMDLLTVDFGSQGGNPAIEVHLDSQSGPLIGTVAAKSTGDNYIDWTMFAPVSTRITHTTGVHTVFLTFPNGSGNIASFRFGSASSGQSAYTRIPAILYESLGGNAALDCNGSCVGHLDGGSWVKYSHIDFGSGATSFIADIASDGGKSIDVHLDSPTGTLIGTLQVQNSGGLSTFIPQRTVVQGATGVHDLYLVIPGTQVGAGNIDWLSFDKLTSNGSANLAYNKPATASSVDDPADDAMFAVDGNQATRWSSGYTDAQWFMVDLGTRSFINEVKMSWQNGTDSPNTYQLQVSDDAQTWTTIYTSTNGGGNEDITGLSANGRYIRMNGSKRSWPWGYTFYEFEVYGANKPAPGDTLPAPWLSQDIGAVGKTGSVTYNSSAATFAVAGSGSDIWGTADAFHYVYQTLDGDGTIIAHIADMQGTDPWAKAGVMIRENLSPDARNAFMALTAEHGSIFQVRSTTGGSSNYTAGPRIRSPYWVKLQRQGATFTGWVSKDGVIWKQVGSATIPIANRIVYIGLAVTSHNNDKVSTSVFDSLSINETPWSNLALNKTATASSVNDPNTPDKAVDGNLSTRWESQQNVDPQWLQIDLGGSHSVSEVVIAWETAYASSYEVQISNDGSNWTSIYSTTTGTGGTVDLKNLSGSGRYVRIYGTQRGHPFWGYSIYEVQIYGL